jgi:23S rRNA (adenine2030-N6)-methyltransferase
MVWYPIIPRPEAHELPRRLKTISRKAGKPFVNATLAIGQAESSGVVLPGEVAKRPGLTASGVFVINPPHTLKPRLEPALAAVLAALRRGRGAAARVETA